MTEHAWQPLAGRDQAPGDVPHRTVVEVTVIFRYEGTHAPSTAVADAELRLAGAGPGAEIVHVTAWRPVTRQPESGGEDINLPAPGAFLDDADVAELDAQAAQATEQARDLYERGRAAVDALALGIYDGAHHKNYAIDQAARALLGDGYTAWAASQPGWAHLAEGSCPP